MKLLFLCSTQFDYLQDLTYCGLVELLGNQNVCDYPWNPKYHLPIKNYPKNLGYTGFSLPKFTIKNFQGYDAVIIGSAKKEALLKYEYLIPKIQSLPVIFIDGGDREEIGGDFYRLGLGKEFESVFKKRYPDLIFKREYLPSLHGHLPHVFPFPFSFPFTLSQKPVQEKKYQVSFWAQQKPLIREQAIKLLKGKYDCDQNGTTLNQGFKTYKRKGLFYLEEISRCKIVLNFRGGGWDTMRYWETPAMETFMISQKPEILIPNNFEENKHVAWVSENLSNLIDKIDYYLLNDDERNRMATNAREHLLKYHLNTHRAQFLLGKIKTIIP
ncbi:MAG: glycosyltransferase [Ferruginibacter sp.]